MRFPIRPLPTIIALLGLPLVVAGAPAGGGVTIDAVAAALGAAPGWRSEFTQRYVPAGFEMGASERGTLTLAHPALLRFDYAGEAQRVFASDGAVARHVDPQAGACMAVRLDTATWGRLPLAALLDPGAARASFAITAGDMTLTLIPREPIPELARVDISVDRSSLPERVTVTDESGNRNEFVFARWKKAARPEIETFRPALPGALPCPPDEEP